MLKEKKIPQGSILGDCCYRLQSYINMTWGHVMFYFIFVTCTSWLCSYITFFVTGALRHCGFES